MARADAAGLSDSVTSQAAVLAELVASYLEQTLKATDISMGTFELLSAVKASPAATQAELASRLGITPSSLCEAVQSAAAKGFVEQEGAAKDRRAKRVLLTRKGAKALEEAIGALREAERAATGGLTPNRLSAAVEVLRAASRNLILAMEER